MIFFDVRYHLLEAVQYASIARYAPSPLVGAGRHSSAGGGGVGRGGD
jgi:hypothetical protein